MTERSQLTAHMLFATDFSTPARAAATVAGKLAQQVKPSVALFHALSPLPLGAATPFIPLDESPDDVMDRMTAKAREELDQVRTACFEGVPGLAMRTAVHRNASAAICDAAEVLHSDLIVIGTHGLSGVARLLGGSVAEKVVRHASCSVLVVPPEAATHTIPPRHIVCAVDFSATSLLAVEQAKVWCATFQSKLTLLHVVQSRSILELSLEHAAPKAYARFHEEQVAQSTDRLATLSRARFGDDPRVLAQVITSASPAEAICTYCAENEGDLVMLGTLGQTGLSRMLIGSVAERVARHCAASVLVVRPKP